LVQKKMKKSDKENEEAPPAPTESTEVDSLIGLKAIIESIKKESEKDSPQTERVPEAVSTPEPLPEVKAAESAPVEHEAEKAPPPPIPPVSGPGLSDTELLQIKKILQDMAIQKEELARREAAIVEKEEAVRRGTQLLLERRDDLDKRDSGLKTRENDLRGIASELEKQAKRLAEREGSMAGQRKALEDEEAKRKTRKDEFEAKFLDLAKREERLKSLENDFKVREQHILGIEMEIKECPYCNVKYEFEGIRDLLEEVRGYGLDVKELDQKYNEALIHLKKESYDMALDTARGILRDVKELRTEVLGKGLRYMLASTNSTIKQAREMGLDVKDADNLLKQARTAADRKDYKTAEYLAKEAEYLARDEMKLKSVSDEKEREAPQAPATESETPTYTPGTDSFMQYPAPISYQNEYQEPEAEAPAGPRKYTCTSCYAAFTIGTSQRPVKVSCPSCGNSMIMRD